MGYSLFHLPFSCVSFLTYNLLCVFLQGGCGEGCSQGLPGVPGMSKGEKGDTGKPGVTPLDSCDLVRLWGTGSFVLKHFQLPFVWNVAGNCVHCWVLMNVKVLHRLMWEDVSPTWCCTKSQTWLMTSSLVCSPVFGETAESTGDTTSGQL